jgi:lysophospholipase L1-like esterase
VGAGLLLNEWLLAALFSADGVLADTNRLKIFAFDVGLVCMGGLALLLWMLGGLRAAMRRLRAWSPALFVALVNGAVALCMLAAAEGVAFVHNHWPVEGGPGGASLVFPDGFFVTDPVAGYTIHPSWNSRSTLTVGGKVVYDVTYGTDEFGRRRVPNAPRSPARTVVFFGCSLTFGVGLPDDQTLPALLQAHWADTEVVNYAAGGYGTQQVLALLTERDLRKEVHAPVKLGVYVFFPDHVRRTIGSMAVYNGWGAQMPHYVLESDHVVRHGNFTTGRLGTALLYEVLGLSPLATAFGLDLPRGTTQAHLDLTARIIEEAAAAFRSNFPGSELLVLMHPSYPGLEKEMEDRLTRARVRYLDYSNRLDVKDTTLYLLDGHPSAKGNTMLADWLAEDLIAR